MGPEPLLRPPPPLSPLYPRLCFPHSCIPSASLHPVHSKHSEPEGLLYVQPSPFSLLTVKKSVAISSLPSAFSPPGTERLPESSLIGQPAASLFLLVSPSLIPQHPATLPLARSALEACTCISSIYTLQSQPESCPSSSRGLTSDVPARGAYPSV